jgi:hypothetical protein
MKAATVPSLALAFLAWATTATATMGLRSKFAEVSVEQLKIGRSYSMQELMNFPLRVMNTGTEAIPLSVQVLAPKVAGEFKEGYEPIPDVNWIHVQQSNFTVPPGLEGVTDVVISIPDDPALMGRRFVVYLWTKSENVDYTGVGLKSRLLLSVSSTRPTEAESNAKPAAHKQLANLNFSLNPMEVVMTDVPTGQSVKVRNKDSDSGKESDVVLVSPNPENYEFRLTPVAAWETSLSVPKGFEAAPDPKWLEVANPLVKMKPYSIQPLDMSVRIPADKQFKGRQFMFVLKAEIAGQDISAAGYVKIFVSTAK